MENQLRVLVLWDIDRTLLFAGGVDKQVWRDVCTELTGHEDVDLGVTSGRTDPEILLTALQSTGVGEARSRALLPQALRREAEVLSERVPKLRSAGYALPGAATALAALSKVDGVFQSVLTGNVRLNAELKLTTFRLATYLDLRYGAFGSDDSYRPALVGIARERVRNALGWGIPAARTVIVGDSVRDVRAAEESGAAMVAVASGRTSAEDLVVAGAPVVLADLRDTEAVVRAVLGSVEAAPSAAG